MAKTVFRPFEIVSLQSTMVLKHEGQEAGQELQAVEEAPGAAGVLGPDAPTTCAARPRPSRRSGSKEKDALIASAKAEADRIVQDAEGAAFEEVRRKTNQAQKLRQEAEEEATGS